MLLGQILVWPRGIMLALENVSWKGNLHLFQLKGFMTFPRGFSDVMFQSQVKNSYECKFFMDYVVGCY